MRNFPLDELPKIVKQSTRELFHRKIGLGTTRLEMRKTPTKSKKPGKKVSPPARLNRSQAWAQLERLWESTTVAVQGDRLSRSQLNERR